MSNIECLGFLATFLVIASFLFQNILLIRGINTIGSVIWVVYGILAKSPSVVTLNAIVICLHLVQMARYLKKGKTQ